MRRPGDDRPALFCDAAGRRHRAGPADHHRPGAGAASAGDRGAARRGIGAHPDDPAAAPRSRVSAACRCGARTSPGFRAYLDRHPQQRPVLEWAIRWLETHMPEPLPPVLCHRDFRTGNYMLDGPELTGDPRLGIRRLGRPGRGYRLVLLQGLALCPARSRGRRHRRTRGVLSAPTKQLRAGVSIRSGYGSGRCSPMSAGPSSRCSRATAI